MSGKHSAKKKFRLEKFWRPILMFTRCIPNVKSRDIPAKSTHPIMLFYRILEETLQDIFHNVPLDTLQVQELDDTSDVYVNIPPKKVPPKKSSSQKSFSQTNSYVSRRKNYQFTPYICSAQSMSPAQIIRLADPTPPEGLKGPSARCHQPTWAKPSPYQLHTNPHILQCRPQKPTRPVTSSAPRRHQPSTQTLTTPTSTPHILQTRPQKKGFSSKVSLRLLLPYSKGLWPITYG